MHDIARKIKHTDLDGGVLEKNVIRAALSPKIARTIFTGMVSNKLAYVIREIGKNCHEVSPPNKPWTLKLPTPFDTRAVFRDFGPGLSHHFMKYRYPKIGESTRDKNGVNGMSGLGYGSKSPLAVLIEEDECGSYNVNSYQNGRVRYYLISLTEKGDIQIKLMAETDTTEPDGLEVSVDIPVDDIQAFTDAAHEVLWSFTPRPVITPTPPSSWWSPVVVDSGPGWTRYAPTSVPWQGAQVRVDHCVMYPVALDQIEGVDGIVNRSYCIVFEVDKDAVDATASREALQYTTKTKASIKAAIENYTKATIDAAQAEIDKEPTFFKAWTRLSQITYKHDTTWTDLITKSVTWKNFKIPRGAIVANLEFKVDMLIPHWKILTGFRDEKQITVHAIDGAEIVVQIGTDRSFERLEKLNLVGKKIVWFRVKQAGLKDLLRRFGLKDGDYHLLNAVKLPPREKIEKPVVVTKKLPVFKAATYRDDIRVTPVDISQPRLYLRGAYHSQKRFKKRFQVRFRSQHPLLTDHIALIDVALKAGLIKSDVEVVIVSDDFAVPDDWTEWSGKLLADVQAFYDVDQTVQKDVGSFSKVNDTIKNLLSEKVNDVDFPQDLAAIIDRGKALQKKVHTSIFKTESIHDKISEVLNGLGIQQKVKLPTEVVDYEQEFNTLIDNKYPLLRCVFLVDRNRYPYERGIWDGDTKKLRYYLKLIELAHPLVN